MIVTEQVPAASVQLPPGVNVTVPVGVEAPEPLVSATVAVHVVAWLTTTDAGEHATVVLVVLIVTVTVVLPLLPACVPSPPYDAETVSVPAADGVIDTEHVALAVDPASVHVPPGVKVTVPVGVVGDPLVSVTVAVQLVAWLIATVEGEHDTVVVVTCSAPTLTVAVPELPECTVLPPYVPVIVAVPAVVPVYVTEHEPLASVHDAPIVPIDAVNVTVPVGVEAVPGEVSVTVAVHVLVPPTVTLAGEHATAVLVVLRLTVIDDVPLETRCAVSPP